MSGPIYDVAVIGGGLHGLSAALHLARAGQRVVLVERSWIGRHASGASAAGVRTLGRDLAELPISLEASDMWHRIGAIVGDDCGFHAVGQLRVAEFDRQIPSLEARAAKTRALGHTHEEVIGQDELRRLVPALAPHCVAALIVRDDGAADPHRTLKAFRTSCEAAGVEIRENCAVLGIERKGCDWQIKLSNGDIIVPAIVNAAGAWGARLAAMIGDDIPLGVKASMMIVTERLPPLVRPVVSAVGRTLSFKQTDQGTLLIGGGLQGTADIDTLRSEVDMTRLAKGARAVAEMFPQLRDVRITRTWAGMEAATRDLLPVVGASPNAPGIVHAFGFSGHGFQLVPVMGAILADLVLRGGTNRVIAGLSPERLMAPA